MTKEAREFVKIIIDDGVKKETRFLENENMRWICVLPACKYSDVGSRALTPIELNEAVQMWMNKNSLSEPKGNPQHDSVYQRLEALEKFRKQMEAMFCNCPVKDFESWKSEARAFNNCLQTILCEQKDKIDQLEKKVKVLEYQHPKKSSHWGERDPCIICPITKGKFPQCEGCKDNK